MVSSESESLPAPLPRIEKGRIVAACAVDVVVARQADDHIRAGGADQMLPRASATTARSGDMGEAFGVHCILTRGCC
jgi:hypothetical protein